MASKTFAAARFSRFAQRMRWSFFSAAIATKAATAADRLRRRRRRQNRAWWAPFSAIVFLSSAMMAHATTVTPPSFPELVAEAQVIARATVTAIESRWVRNTEGPVIKTFVRFAVEKALKGSPDATLTLAFLGGTVGSESLKVNGMPEFSVGDSEIVFVSGNGVQFCPLVRFSHGRYRIRTEASSRRKFVARDDDTPLGAVSDVRLPPDTHGIARSFRTADTALSPEDFEAQIATEVARTRR